MLTGSGDIVTGRKFLDDFDIGHQSGTSEGSLEKIVAEKRALGYAVGERGLEGIHVIDAFAGVRAQPEKILINVGYGGRIRIDAARA